MNKNIIVLLLGLGACSTSEDGVKIINSDPTATITSHSSGAEFFEGEEITLIGLVSDANHSNAQLIVRWTSDIRTLCENQEPDLDGTSSCRIALEEEETKIKLQVQDPESAAAIAEIDISVTPTESPSVQIISPVVDGTYYSDQLISFQAIVEDSEDEASDLLYQWESSLDGVLPITTPPDTDGSIEGYVNLSAGQHAISLRVEDTTGKVTTESIAITVGGANTPPTCSIESPGTGSAYVLGQSINFVGLASDDDINNSLLQASWSSNIDGIFDTTAPFTDGSLTVSTNALSAGTHTITLRVEDEVNEICTSGIQIDVGTPPTLLLTAPVQSTIYDFGAPILFSGTVTDQEDLESDILLSWYSDLDGEFSTQGADSNGNISFSTSSLSAGTHNILVTATDSTGLTASTSLVLQINSGPVFTTAASISPNTGVFTGTTLTCSSSVTDPDDGALTPSYEWLLGSSVIATGSTYTVLSSDTNVGDTLTCLATAEDSSGEIATSNVSVVIENTAPECTSTTISYTTAYNDDTLTCSGICTDPDESLTISYEWYLQSTLIGSANTLDLSTTSVLPEDTITCSVSMTDTLGAGDSDSAILDILNRAPDSPILFITPTNPTAGVDDLTCQMSTPTDPDGQTLTESFEWESSDGTLISGSTVLAQDTTEGETWTCYGTVSDGIDSTEASESVSIASEGCPEAGTAQTSEGHELLGYCWYLTLPNGTCDATCGSVSGGTNLMTEAQSTITSVQMNTSSAAQSAMHLFYINGNPGNFTGPGSGSWPGLGYAYHNGTYYHRVNGTNSAAFPGNTRGTDSDRMFACACIHSN